MSDNITFNCTTCGKPVLIDNDNPPNDEDIFSCMECGFEFGKYSDVKKAMIELAKREVGRMVKDSFGVKPTWTKS
ncbi:MAG: hypothetical protein JKY83_08130 [Rhizobiaceae bacterium]|nr:hypothetical protein [Rhizobiaceae bacterium]